MIERLQGIVCIYIIITFFSISVSPQKITKVKESKAKKLLKADEKRIKSKKEPKDKKGKAKKYFPSTKPSLAKGIVVSK